MTGKWIGSFIPQHVSNRVLLGGYRMLSLFGVPGFIREKHFRKNGFSVETAYGEEVFAVEEIGCKYAVMTATAYNDKNDITAQIHTVCITRNQDGSYVLHNAYRRDEKGRYRESAPYESLQEAAACISEGKSKLIYLIGIEKKRNEAVCFQTARLISPQPIFSPAFPAGWEVKSSGFSCMMTDFPMISGMVNLLS